MEDLKFLCIQPDDDYYLWQVHLWLESLRKIGHSDKAIVLLFIPQGREKNLKWENVIKLYPEAEFHFYKDEEGVSKLLSLYIPVLRPYCAFKHFKAHPELATKSIFYCDSDILFTEKFDISHLNHNKMCYLSDTNSYINASYFDSKVKDVLPDKLERYKQRDILHETAQLVGITREICEKNNLHSGGAQYLLKNIDYKFWENVLTGCIVIRQHLLNVNKAFFENENKGFQSWCADMWAVLWNLWKEGKETKIVKELDFAWAPDPIEKLETHPILHNAGITAEYMDKVPMFYKGKYHTGKSPFQDPHLETVLNNEESKKRCTHYYVTKLIELKNKYNL